MNLELAIVDVETTGLDPTKHRVVELCLNQIVMTRDSIEVVDKFYFKQKISKSLHCWESKALEINGYSEEAWKDAPLADSTDARSLWEQLGAKLQKKKICSQNVPFDRAFIFNELSRAEVKVTPDVRYCEMYSFSSFIALEHQLKSWTLSGVYRAIGGPELTEHRADTDVARCIYILDHFRKSYFCNKKESESL